MDSAEIVYKYFPDLSVEQKQQFEQLGSLYADWNAKINVISRKDIDNFYERHVLHSLGIAKVIQFKPQTTILDVGTGGGFPGIPLAILFPACRFYLIDSIAKKIKIVQDAVAQLNLKNVKAVQHRISQQPMYANVFEEERPGDMKFHFVVSRAVTDLDEFQTWVNNKIASDNFNEFKNGILYLRGDGDVGRRSFDLRSFFSEPFFDTKKVVFIPAE